MLEERHHFQGSIMCRFSVKLSALDFGLQVPCCLPSSWSALLSIALPAARLSDSFKLHRENSNSSGSLLAADLDFDQRQKTLGLSREMVLL